MRWTSSIEERYELIDDVVVDGALKEFLHEFGEPDIIFLCFFFIFLCSLDPSECGCRFFALLFALLCDFAREIETVQAIISCVEGHRGIIVDSL